MNKKKESKGKERKRKRIKDLLLHTAVVAADIKKRI